MPQIPEPPEDPQQLDKSATEVRSGQNVRTPWAIPIGQFAGIPIRIHFTFVLFVLWIALSDTGATGALWAGFVVTVFACVLLHELGHAVAAQRFSVRTRDITLYPMGGVAMLQDRPTPRAEVWIALAGPAVNLLIAALLAPFVLATKHPFAFDVQLQQPGGFLQALFGANLILALFNLIPAFPMDGGRVLRGALALRVPQRQATKIAAGVGQFLAIALGFWAVYTGSILPFIVAAVVFFGASHEYTATITRSFLEGHLVTDAMIVRFRTLESGASLEKAAATLLEGSQHDFPVLVGDEVVGVLSRTAIARGLATDGPTGFVAAHMNREFLSAPPTMPLEDAIELISTSRSSSILIMEDEKLVGILTQDNVSEFIMLEHARAQGRNVAD